MYDTSGICRIKWWHLWFLNFHMPWGKWKKRSNCVVPRSRYRHKELYLGLFSWQKSMGAFKKRCECVGTRGSYRIKDGITLIFLVMAIHHRPSKIKMSDCFVPMVSYRYKGSIPEIFSMDEYVQQWMASRRCT